MANLTVPWACYAVGTNRVVEQDPLYLPCKEPTAEQPFVPCCGAGTICLSDNYCVGNALGPYHYYIGECTDPNFNDPSCSTHCKFDYSKTVSYNLPGKQWECCDTRNLTGNDPGAQCALPESDERWASPLPSLLSTVTSLPVISPTTWKYGTPTFSSTSITKSSSGSGSSSASASGTGVNAANPTVTVQNNSGLSTGAKAGIGVGVGLGVATFLVLIGLLVVTRRKRTKSYKGATGPVAATGGVDKLTADEKHAELPDEGRLELAGTHSGVELEGTSPQELPDTSRPVELPAHTRH